MNRRIAGSDNWMVIGVLSVIICVAGALNAITGELNPRFNGLGGDGMTLAEIAKDLYGSIIVEKLDKYWLSKSLQSIIVGSVFNVFNIPFTDPNIVLAFRILNAVCLVGTVALWTRIADLLEISVSWKWLGGFLTVLSYPVLKAMYFHPVGQDYVTLLIGTTLLFLYLKENLGLLLFVSIIGFFSRPTLLYTGLILFVLPRGLKFTPTAKSSPLVNAWVVLIAAFYLVSLLYFRFRNFPVDEAGITLTAVFTELKHMPHLGVILALGYIALVYSKLLAPLRVEMRLFIWHRWLIAIVVFVTVNYLAGHVLARPSHADELYFLQRLVFSSGSWPLKFIIAHVAFFGPVILLMIIFWKRLSAAIIEAGVGLTAVFTLALFHGIDSESRHLIEYYVFIIALTAKACHAMDWKRWQLVGLAVVAFFISRAWMPFLQGPRQEDPVNFYKFPEQYYFMTWGPFMSHEMYRLQGAVVVGLLVVFFFVFRRRPGFGSAEN